MKPFLFAFVLILSSGTLFSQSNLCGSATPISSATTCTATAGTLVSATYTVITGACGANGGNRNDVWYKFTAQSSTVLITVAGTVADPRFQVYGGTCGSPTNIFCSTSGTGTATGLSVGLEYLLRVYSNTNSSSTFTICLQHSEPLPTRMKEVFKETILANNQVGINSAWELTYEDQEDSLWMTENRSYRIRKMHPGTGQSRVILDLSDIGGFDANYRRSFTSTQDPWPQGGMMGFAIHPQFLAATSPKNFVYVAYVRDFVGPGPGNTAGTRNRTVTNTDNGGEAVKGDLFRTFIVRFTYNTTTKVLESPVALCDTVTGSNDHNSGRLLIAPLTSGGSDYFLFYSCGDMGAGQFYSAERTYKTQMINSYEGKILRFNLEEDGDAVQNAGPRNTNYNRWIPDDNPYNNVAPVTGQSAVWNIGHRNVQGLACINGKLFGSSHGPFSDDEVNYLQSNRNYGHPHIIGKQSDNNYNGSKAAHNFTGWGNEHSGNPLNSTLPLISSETGTSLTNYSDPVYSFFDGITGSATTTVVNGIYNAGQGSANSAWPSIAPSGMDAYNNSKIPGWKNSLVLASLKRGYMMRIKPNTSATGVDQIGGSDTAVIFNQQNRFRDLAFDPDGWSVYGAVDRSGSTSGPTATTPVNSACPGCIIKYTFLGYNDNAGTSTIPSGIPIDDTLSTGACITATTVIINSTNNNNNIWVPITGPKGNIVAEINANGNNLGNVTSSFFTRSGSPVRQIASGDKYANRNITINVQNQPTAGNPAAVRLYITAAELASIVGTAGSGVTSITDLGIFKNSDPCGNSFAASLTEQQVITGRYVQSSFGHALQANIQSFSSFYFFNTSSTLPVDFITISAAEKNNAANIQWTVTNQGTIFSYIVERSIDSRNFDAIGTVTAVNGSGDIKYNFTDYNAARFSSVVYYRVRAVEQSGQFKFTHIVNVGFGAIVKEMIRLYPNPANDKTSLSIASNNDETTQVRIFDNTGRVVSMRFINIVKGSNRFEINISTLSTGLYYVEITGKTISQTIKLVKQ